MSRITLRAREHVALSPPLKEMKEQNARRRLEQSDDDQSASSSMPSPRDEHIHSLAWANASRRRPLAARRTSKRPTPSLHAIASSPKRPARRKPPALCGRLPTTRAARRTVV